MLSNAHLYPSLISLKRKDEENIKILFPSLPYVLRMISYIYQKTGQPDPGSKNLCIPLLLTCITTPSSPSSFPETRRLLFSSDPELSSEYQKIYIPLSFAFPNRQDNSGRRIPGSSYRFFRPLSTFFSLSLVIICFFTLAFLHNLQIKSMVA